jgi:hypothetical protein
MNQRCIDNQTPPKLNAGEVVEDGVFFRNLKKSHIAKRYENDSDDHPRFGFKITKRHWADAASQGLLSVNLESCLHSAQCSIALQPVSEHHYHVAVLNLRKVNIALETIKSSDEPSSQLVAKYSPVESPRNLCHFEIQSKDGTILDWMKLRVLLDSPFPECRLPSHDTEEERDAITAYEKFKSYCKIARWIRSKDGGLAELPLSVEQPNGKTASN